MKVDISRFSGKCSCGKEHAITVDEIIIEPKAVKHLSRVAAGSVHPVIVCDKNTRAAAYPYMKEYFDNYEVAMIPEDSVHADDHFVKIADQLISEKADLLIAAGAGTIHDLTRYVAYQRGISFVSVPTAASVDGFVSVVAAMTWHGMKKTLPAAAPVCVLADTDIFGKAPWRLTASGISDLMGKYTALTDWRVCHVLFGEYFCQTVYDLDGSTAGSGTCFGSDEKRRAGMYGKTDVCPASFRTGHADDWQLPSGFRSRTSYVPPVGDGDH